MPVGGVCSSHYFAGLDSKENRRRAEMGNHRMKEKKSLRRTRSSMMVSAEGRRNAGAFAVFIYQTFAFATAALRGTKDTDVKRTPSVRAFRLA